MNDVNTVIVVGHLARDIELKYTQSGMAIADSALAVNRSVKTADGYKNSASFFDFSIFGKAAESLKPYLLKGKQVAITGYLKQETWADRETDAKRSRVKICATEIELLGGGAQNNNSNSQQSDGYGYTAESNTNGYQEDIPF